MLLNLQAEFAVALPPSLTALLAAVPIAVLVRGHSKWAVWLPALDEGVALWNPGLLALLRILRTQ